MKDKVVKILGVIGISLLVFIIFGYYCPFEKMTGIPCPGCNMVTSAYWLFAKQDLNTSLFYHAMLIPTILVGCVCAYYHYKNRIKVRNRILIGWGICMILYYLYRMIFIFPDIPMVYNEANFLRILFFR